VSTLRNWEQGRVLSDPAARSLSHRCQESESRAQSACDVECKAIVAQIERKAKSGSLHRMLSKKGNPSMDNLAAIFDAVRKSWE